MRPSAACHRWSYRLLAWFSPGGRIRGRAVRNAHTGRRPLPRASGNVASLDRLLGATPHSLPAAAAEAAADFGAGAVRPGASPARARRPHVIHSAPSPPAAWRGSAGSMPRGAKRWRWRRHEAQLLDPGLHRSVPGSPRSRTAREAVGGRTVRGFRLPQDPFPERLDLGALPGGGRGDEAAAFRGLGLAVEDGDEVFPHGSGRYPHPRRVAFVDSTIFTGGRSSGCPTDGGPSAAPAPDCVTPSGTSPA